MQILVPTELFTIYIYKFTTIERNKVAETRYHICAFLRINLFYKKSIERATVAASAVHNYSSRSI
jgi:hypothetical protein